MEYRVVPKKMVPKKPKIKYEELAKQIITMEPGEQWLEVSGFTPSNSYTFVGNFKRYMKKLGVKLNVRSERNGSDVTLYFTRLS